MATVTGIITKLTRNRNSVNGNPSYDVTVNDSATYRTGRDSYAGYDIQNFDIGDTVTMVTDAYGKVYTVVGPDESTDYSRLTMWCLTCGQAATGTLEERNAQHVDGAHVPNWQADA